MRPVVNKPIRWALLGSGLCAFALFVWPTRYDRYTYEGMTVLRHRWTGCEKVLTPAGERSIGRDERCFLPHELNGSKSAAVIPVYAHESLRAPDEASQMVGDVMRDEDLLDFTSERQLNVIEQLETSVTLSRPAPVLRIINNSRCTVDHLTLNIRSRGTELGEYKFDTGMLEPGQEVQDYLSLRHFATLPRISITSVIFHDDGDWLSSACAE